jgi:hypothetical protein
MSVRWEPVNPGVDLPGRGRNGSGGEVSLFAASRARCARGESP